MKGIRWKYCGSVLGVLLFLLLNIFFIKNTNAAVIETDAPKYGIIGCNANTEDIVWETSRGELRSKCGRWSGQTIGGNNSGIYTVKVSFANTNNEYKFKQDAYAIVSFGIGISGTGTTLPTGFLARNISAMSVLETNMDIEYGVDQIYNAINSAGNITTIGNAATADLHDIQYATYNLKVKVRKGAIWNGKLDLATSITMPDSNSNIFQIFMTEVKLQWYESSESAINEMNEKDDQDRQNLENQNGQTSSDANNSEQQLSSGTSSLMGVISSFSSAMVSITRTNCKISGINAYGFDLGELDLCTYSPPAWIQGLTSALVSLIMIRLAYKVFKRIMGLVKGMAQ